MTQITDHSPPISDEEAVRYSQWMLADMNKSLTDEGNLATYVNTSLTWQNLVRGIAYRDLSTDQIPQDLILELQEVTMNAIALARDLRQLYNQFVAPAQQEFFKLELGISIEHFDTGIASLEEDWVRLKVPVSAERKREVQEAIFA
tara:strand:- start:1846 stop:2283 length:438 start_codon:yes stop_codon:yes gene_type:complete